MSGIPTFSGETGDGPVVVERTYGASLQELWDLWTTKDGFEAWWGPDGFRVEVHRLEPHEGGALDYDMIAASPEAIAAMTEIGQPLSHATHGRYALFHPQERLRLVHVIDFIDGVDPYETAIDVTFAALGDRTRMVVTLHPHRDPHWTRMSALGFASQLTKLDRRYGWTGT